MRNRQVEKYLQIQQKNKLQILGSKKEHLQLRISRQCRYIRCQKNICNSKYPSICRYPGNKKSAKLYLTAARKLQLRLHLVSGIWFLSIHYLCRYTIFENYYIWTSCEFEESFRSSWRAYICVKEIEWTCLRLTEPSLNSISLFLANISSLIYFLTNGTWVRSPYIIIFKRTA